MSATGSSADILSRVKQTIPKGWFAFTAPYRDAVLGGLSDAAAWCYTLITYARQQTRLASVNGIWLDLLAFDFLGRTLTRNGSQDDAFRALIKATILQERVTRAGMIAAVKALTGKEPLIFEPWNTFDTGGYGNSARGIICGGQFGYGVGSGGYGNMNLPAQALMQIHRTTPSGVPDVDGYGGTIGGYGAGGIEYVSGSTQLEGVTDALIEQVVNQTKPTGSIIWVAFAPTAQFITTDSGSILTDDSNNSLTTI